MEKEFCTYTQSLRLKVLGFDEPCFGFYDDIDKVFSQIHSMASVHGEEYSRLKITKAPTFQQAFRWFREKYNLHHVIHQFNFKKDTDEEYLAEVDKIENGFEYFRTYEECEHFCLNKLIEIVESKKE